MGARWGHNAILLQEKIPSPSICMNQNEGEGNCFPSTLSVKQGASESKILIFLDTFFLLRALSQAFEEVAERFYGSIENHPWTRPSHNLAYFLPFGWCVAVHRTVFASRLRILPTAAVKSTATVVQQPQVLFVHLFQSEPMFAIEP